MRWKRFLMALFTGGAMIVAVFHFAGQNIYDAIERWIDASRKFQEALTIFLIALPGLALSAVIATRGAASPSNETRCRKCGYILRGITEPRCPECGQRI